MAIFVVEMMLHIEKPNQSTKKLLELISQLGKVTDSKINISKVAVFLYTNDRFTERDIRKEFPFTRATHMQKHNI